MGDALEQKAKKLQHPSRLHQSPAIIIIIVTTTTTIVLVVPLHRVRIKTPFPKQNAVKCTIYNTIQ